MADRTKPPRIQLPPSDTAMAGEGDHHLNRVRSQSNDSTSLLPVTPGTLHCIQYPEQYRQIQIQAADGSVFLAPDYSSGPIYSWAYATNLPTIDNFVEPVQYENEADQVFDLARTGDPYILERRV